MTIVDDRQTLWSDGWGTPKELQQAMPVFVKICVRAERKPRDRRLLAFEAKSAALFDLRFLRQKREVQTGRAEVKISATPLRRS